MKIIKLDTTGSKTYATEANAIKAVTDRFGDADLRCIIMTNEQGRFFPVFIGESAVQHGVHFYHHVIN